MNIKQKVDTIADANTATMKAAQQAGEKSCTIQRPVWDENGMRTVPMAMYYYNHKWNRKPYEDALRAAMNK